MKYTICSYGSNPAAATLLNLVILSLYRHFCAPFQVLKRNGIKGPKPSFFYGNYKDWVRMVRDDNKNNNNSN